MSILRWSALFLGLLGVCWFLAGGSIVEGLILAIPLAVVIVDTIAEQIKRHWPKTTE